MRTANSKSWTLCTLATMTLVGAGALGQSAPALAADGCGEDYGDVNADGAVDALDVQCMLLTALEGMATPGTMHECVQVEAEQANMSCHPQGRIDILDAQLTTALALGQDLPPEIDANGDNCPNACQSSCGDGMCDEVHGENCQTCPFDCGVCADSCCVAQADAGCNDDGVEACVCAISSFCCDFFWDESCVGLATEFCGAECFVPACSIQTALSCGQTITGSTVGAPSEKATYGCAGSGNLSGPEHHYAFLPQGDFQARLTLSGTGAQSLRVLALGDTCEAGDCLGSSATAVTFSVQEGQVYYPTVDGLNGAAGSYTLQLSCSDGCDPAEVCGDKVCGTAQCEGFAIPCGTCPSGEVCTSAGQCEAPSIAGCPGAGDCFEANGSQGCNDTACCVLVCQSDPFCCNTTWDGTCASGAANLCDQPCGDGFCDAAEGETCDTCPSDCGCGSGQDCIGGACVACEAEAVCAGLECGDATCGGVAFPCGTCEGDATCGPTNLCYQCGDGVCEQSAGETCQNCPADCACEDDLECVQGECIGADKCVQSDPPLQIACNQSVSGNNADGVNAMSGYNCVGWNESGPELVYTFTPPVDTEARIRLVNTPTSIDLFVLEGACNNESCIDFGNTNTTLDVVGGQTYYLVVDGFNGATSPFTLQVECEALCEPGLACAAAECGFVSCYDDLYVCGGCEAGAVCGSNQCVPCGDGECDASGGETCLNCPADCSCPGEDVCVAGGACSDNAVPCDLSAPETISCGQTISSTNAGGPTAIGQYNCVGWNESGPEKVFVFESPGFAEVGFQMTNIVGGDVDVFALQANCTNQNCIAHGNTGGSFTSEPGATYYIVVDGFNGAVASFDLTISCAIPCDEELVCQDKECGDIECFGLGTVSCGTCEEGEVCGSDGWCALCGDGVCSGAAGEDCNTCAADCACTGSKEVCTPSGACEVADAFCVLPQPVPALACGDVIEGTTQGGPIAISTYGCSDTARPGPEAVFALTAPFADNFEIRLSGANDQALFLMPGTCADLTCSQGGGDTLSFSVQEGDVVYVVVDGTSAVGSAFELEVLCSSLSCELASICAGVECGPVTCLGDSYSCGGCGEGEVCQGGVCVEGDGPCCEAIEGGFCPDPTCAGCVCPLDPFCCDTSWDGLCAGRANDECAPACGCTIPDCDPVASCAGVECGNAECGNTTVSCGGCTDGTVCSNNVCVEATTTCCTSLGTGNFCGSAACTSCVCPSDSFCCNTGWDTVCAGAATGACASACGCN